MEIMRCQAVGEEAALESSVKERLGCATSATGSAAYKNCTKPYFRLRGEHRFMVVS